MAEQLLSDGCEETSDRDLVRRIAHFQTENSQPDGIVEGSGVVDFAAGLGDLSAHVSTLGLSQLIATVPEPDARERLTCRKTLGSVLADYDFAARI